MAKKKTFLEGLSSTQIEANNLARIEYFVALGNLIYADFLKELANLAASIPGGIASLKVFSFDDFPGTRERLANLVRDTNLKVTNSITGGIDDALLRAHGKNDALISEVFEATNISKKKLARYYTRNLTAAATRRTKSELSKRVYKITNQFKQIAEAGIDVGLTKGKSATTLARSIKEAVKEPEFTFRRVRNSKGNLEWSKAAKKYAKENPPGQGVYLNPQKNYERLTRTEINMAYRTADFERNLSMDFIVGIKVNLSNNPNHCPLCIELAGIYPKDFLFRGWHPQCRCFRTTILKSREELDRDNKLILQGKEPSTKSKNTVKQPHKGFLNFIEENKEKLDLKRNNGTSSYWILDNFKDGDISKGLVPGAVRGGVQ